MPNTFAYIALLGWPLVAVYLFSTKSFERAIIWSVIGSFLFLPSSFAIDLPGLPALDKTSISSLTLLMIVPVVAKERFRILPQSLIAKSLIILMIVGAFFTSLTNQDAIWTGAELLPGLAPYDALSNVAQKILMIVPLLVGWQYLANSQAHREFLHILLISGLAYSLLALFEIRMSPQLHSWVYGFFPHSWGQHVRGDGFRPTVFFKHALWLAFFFFSVMLAAVALSRDTTKPSASNDVIPYQANMQHFYLFAIGYLAIVLFLTKSLGSLLYSIVFIPLAMLAKPRTQIRIAVVLALISMTYPLLRSADLVPTDNLVELAQSIDRNRATSLSTRFENEDRLLRHALERPLFGWGRWGRNRIYDEETGKNVSLTDGLWIIVLGEAGWVGYISTLGLLAFPILAVWRQARHKPPRDPPMVTCVLCLLLGINMIEILPNATLPPWTWLIAGALLGYAGNRNRAAANESAKAKVNSQRANSPTP